MALKIVGSSPIIHPITPQTLPHFKAWGFFVPITWRGSLFAQGPASRRPLRGMRFAYASGTAEESVYW